jgi:hypothetical protein
MHRRIILLLCTLALVGCRASPPPDPAPHEEGARARSPRVARYPFAPVSLRVHPLTHVDTAEAGKRGQEGSSEVVLHFELLDKFGDSVKGLGTVTVELYKPGPGMTPGIETQELTWDVPGMDDAEQNTRRFDVATRTYRVPLSAPRWVLDAVSPAHGPGWLKVRVVMTVAGEGGEARYLEDEYVIQG